jgi:hypothetical protein
MTDLDDRDAAHRARSAAGSPRMRASDVDRHATVMALQDAMASGLLTPDEAGERMGTAFSAVHLDDLAALTADLPAGNTSAPRPPGWAALGTLAVEQVRWSLTDGGTGRLNPARVAALLIVLTMIAVVFGVVAAGLFDTGHPPGAGPYGYRH